MANPKSTKLWFKIAIRDLKNSKALIDLGTQHKHAAAYHAQQSAEKAIKGFLTHSDCRVPKTHDLETLANLVANYDQSLANLILKYKSLSDLAIAYRYPDAENKPLTFAKAKSASKQAHLIYDRCYKVTFGKANRSQFLKTFES